MQLKKLSFSLITVCTLIGCGGGGGSDNSSQSTGTDTSNNSTNETNTGNTTSNFQQYHIFEISELENNNNADQVQLQHRLITLNEGHLYIKNLVGETDNTIYLTQNGMYQDLGPKHATYGELAGTGSFQNLMATHNPYSAVGSTGLSFSSKFKKIELNGKNVLASLEPNDQWDLANGQGNYINTARKAYYNTVKDLTFPAGAYCYQAIEHSTNQEYLWLDNSSSRNEPYFNDFAEKFAANDSSIFKKTYKDSLAYLYSYERTDADASWGYAEYKGQYYYAYRTLQGLEYSLAQDIQQQKEQLSSNLTTAERNKSIQKIENANNQCNWYNDTAAQFIQDNMQP